MKSTLLSAVEKVRATSSAPAARLVQQIVILATLVFGGLTAWAAAPMLTLPASVTIGEDTTTNLNIGVTDTGQSIFTVVTTASSSNTNLVSNSSLVFSGAGTSRLLRISPGLHQSGTATITVVATDTQPLSTTNTFTLNVTLTNYPPVFLSAVANLTNNENATATSLPFAVSDVETPASNLVVTVTSLNTTLVASANLVLSGTGTNRTLTLTPATNQSGVTTIELVVTDGGGATATNDFILDVWTVNQPPTFTTSTNRLRYNEFFGPVTIPNFVSGVSSGPPSQAGQTTNFVLTYTTNFFTQAPSLSANGTLTFEVVPNVSGTNSITITLTNNGPTTNGGHNSLAQIIALEVPAIIEPPTFSFASNYVQVAEDSLTVTNLHFVSARSNQGSNQVPSVSTNAWTYTVSTVSTNSTNAAFTTLTLATNGTLTIRPATHTFGTNTVTVVMTVAGRDTNGWINSCTNTFQVQVAPVSHAPVIAGATNHTVLENGTTGLTEQISVWDYDRTTNFNLTATSLSNTVANVTCVSNSAGTSNVNYTLNFVLTPNASGVVPIQLVASEVSSGLSTTNTFNLTVTLVNHAPSFTLSSNYVAISEETPAVTVPGFVASFSKGPANQSAETFTYALTTLTNSATNAAFTTLSVATNGTLTVLPRAHSYGTNTVTMVMTLSGGTNNGGVASATNIFQVQVAPVSHAPVIAGATNRTVLENATTGLTEQISIWDYDRTTNFNLTATSLSNTVANVTCVSNSAGTSNVIYTLNFVLSANASGVVPIQLVASEVSSGLSTTNTFNLTVTLVNHAPSFTLASNSVAITEETPTVTVPGFVASFSKGPANQSAETFTYALTTLTNSATNAAFTTLSVATNGTLTVLPRAHSYGTNTVTMVMTLSGGTNNGGVASATNIFQVQVAPTNHAPVIVGATNRTILENATTGLTEQISVWDYDRTTNFNLTATSLSNTVANVTCVSNSAGTSNVNYTLNFVLTPNASGVVPIQLVASEVSSGLSTTNTFNLTVTLVNSAPSFTLSSNYVAITEETAAVTVPGFVASFSKGPANQSAETFTYGLTTLTNSATNAAFTTLSVATNGTLTVLPRAHSYGTNTVTMVMTLSGGTNNGGVASATNIFQVQVAPTNHAPVIVGATNRTILENTNSGLTATINVWDYDQLSTNFTLTATSSNSSVAGVRVTSNNVASRTNVLYTLTFAPVSNATGVTTIQLVATETNSGLSTTNFFNLTVTGPSSAPSFTLSTNFVLTPEETPSVTQTNFVSGWRSSRVWTFATSVLTAGAATNVTFTAGPLVDTNGTLTFSPTPHTYGTNWVSVIMTDNGTNSFTNTFQIAVQQVSHAPGFLGDTNLTVLENGTNGLVTTNIVVWDYDLTTNFIFTATAQSNLATVSITGSNVLGPSNVAFTLTFAPVHNANGTMPFQLVATEVRSNLSTTNVFPLIITPVNQAPSYAFSGNYMTNGVLRVAENAGPVTNSGFLSGNAGPANQSSQTWTYAAACTTTNRSTNVTFAVAPAVDTNGNLTFTTATNSFGTNTVTVVMTTSGSTANGGINSYTNNFQIAVAQVQYPPAFTGITNVTTLENATTNLTLAFTLYDPLTNRFTVTCTSSDANLAGVTAAGTNTAWTLTFAPPANSNGVATITVVADDGTLTNRTNFTFTVLPVNQPPSFNLAVHSITVDKYNVPVTSNHVVTSISAGPANQSSETVSFNVTNSSPSSFTVQPAIDANGTLTFTPGTTAQTVTVGVQAVNTGGTNNGGTNGSAFQFLTITIPPNAFQYLTGPFAGLFYDTTAVTNASSGYFSLLLTNDGSFTGYVLCAGNSNTFNGQFSISSDTAAVAAANYRLNLAVDTSASWTESITGSVSNATTHWNVPLQSYLAGYSASFPTTLAGAYTMALPGSTNTTRGPSGDSVFSLIVSNNGVVNLTGFMADNTPASQMSQISLSGSYPLYIPLYNNGLEGSLIGWLDITGLEANSVSANPVLTWFNQPGATADYASGFTNQTAPQAAPYDSTLTDLVYFHSGAVILSGGNLTMPITNAVTINNNVITVDPTATNHLSLTVNASTGKIVGHFLDQNGISNYVQAVILQNNTNLALGYFLGTSQDGSFTLLGNGPTISWATNRTVVENATSGLTATINVSDMDGQAANFSLTATSLNTGLATVSVTGSSQASATNVIYTLTFAPVANANGPVTIQLSASEGGLPTTTSFTLNITPVSQAPSFTLSTNFVLAAEETPNVTVDGFVPGWQSSATWTFACTTTGNASFSAAPAVDTDGTLTFSPAAHSFGTNLVTVVMTDTTNYFTNTFQIGIAQIAHAPVITLPNNLSVLENAASGSATIPVWDYDQTTALPLTVLAHSGNLSSVSVSAATVAGPSNVSYTLTYVPVVNANGPATIQLVASEGSLSVTNTLTLTITPVNQAPSYAFSTISMTNGTLIVNENAGVTTSSAFLTSISPGPANQSGETWTFTVTPATGDPTNATFSQPPTVDSSGTLTFATATNSFGTNIMTVVMTTSGSTANGGINTYTGTFLLEVAQVQYPPVFTGIADQTILENGAPGSLAFTVYDPLTNNFVLTATSSDTTLATVSVTGNDTSWTVSYTPVANANGSVVISLSAAGLTLTGTTNFNLTITPVNQPPTFNLSTTTYAVTQFGQPVTIPNFVTGISVGAPNESSQTVIMSVTNNSNGSFSAQPALDGNGNLTFTPNTTGGQTVTVGIVAHDNGGTANGGQDTSVQYLTITIPQNNFQPLAGSFAGLFTNATAVTSPGTGYFSLALANDGSFTGSLMCGSDNPTFSGQFSIANNTATVSVSSYVLNLSLDTSGSQSVTGTVNNTAAGWNAILLSYLADSTTSLAGTYLMALPGLGDSTVGPIGDSIFTLTVGANGVVTLAGTMSDSSNATQVSQISQGGYFPLYVPLYGGANSGLLYGWLNIYDSSTNNVTANPTVTWINETGATLNVYPNGFTNQSMPQGALYNATAPNALFFSSGLVILSGGSLTLPITNAVTISDNTITVDPSATDSLALTLDASTGTVQGTFVDPISGNTCTIAGVILQNATNSCAGYFTGTGEEGLFVLTPVSLPPAFSFSSPVVNGLENAGASTHPAFLTGLNSGLDYYSSQTWTFAVTSASGDPTNVTFSQAPAIDPTGNLTFTTATNSFGTNVMTVVMTDVNNNTPSTNTFLLEVSQVPYPPVFTGITAQTVLENSSAGSLSFSVYDPLTPSCAVTATSGDTTLATVSVTGSGSDWTVTYTPVTDANGNVTINLQAVGTTLTGNTNFTLTITPVNQAPSFNLNVSSYTVDSFNAPVSIPNVVSGISAGPPNESTQTVAMSVTNSSPSSFTAQPTLDGSGNLNFTPGTTGGQSVTVGIIAQDNGGTANGGNDTAVQYVTITIPPNNFQPQVGSFAGLFFDTTAVAPASSGYFRAALSADGSFSGYLLCAGDSNNFSGQFSIANNTATVTSSSYTLSLTFSPTDGTIGGTVANTAGWSATLVSYLAAPTSLTGGYLVALPGFSDPTAGPAGYGDFILTINNDGTASVSGYTADNTAGTQISQTSAAGNYPFYLRLYANGANGVLFGWLNMTGAETNSVTGTSVLTWFNEAGATALYPAGFTNQALPQVSLYNQNASPLLSFTSGTVTLSGGNLTAPITTSVTISGSTITVDPSATDSLTLTIDPTTGEIQGSFVDPTSLGTDFIDGIILQNTVNSAAGYFLGTTEGGSFTLTGN